MHSFSQKQKALSMRKEGFSYGEISKILNVSKSTAHFWTHNTPLDEKSYKLLQLKRRSALLKAIQVLKAKRDENLNEIRNRVRIEQSSIPIDKNSAKLLCSLLFWAEGSKSLSQLRFSNSDPKMIHLFINLLRYGFDLDESKFRIKLHLHGYHNEKELKSFWAKVSGVPEKQFLRPYLKQNSDKRKRKGYKGFVNINYYSSAIARELESTYNAFADLHKGAW